MDLTSILSIIMGGVTLIFGAVAWMLNVKFNQATTECERLEDSVDELRQGRERDQHAVKSDVKEIFSAIEKIAADVKAVEKAGLGAVIDKEKSCAAHKAELTRSLQDLERDCSNKYLTKAEYYRERGEA